jgi:hypothetical protein
MQNSEIVLTPILTRGPGRPRNNRILGIDERDLTKLEKRILKKCSKCGAFGHNTRTCKGPATATNERGVEQMQEADLEEELVEEMQLEVLKEVVTGLQLDGVEEVLAELHLQLNLVEEVVEEEVAEVVEEEVAEAVLVLQQVVVVVVQQALEGV